MKLEREDLLSVLRTASVGAALPPRTVVIEQSDCFVFQDGWLHSFNDELYTRTKSPLDFDVVVSAAELLGVLGKLPDRTVRLELKDGELVVRGKRRSAGITTQAEVSLPFGEVPRPEKWRTVGEGVTNLMKQAAWTCGKDMNDPLTTVVHVTPEVVESCDNARLFRARAATGFKKSTLIPAYALESLEAVPLRKVSLTLDDAGYASWAHFRTSSKEGKGTEVSVRCTPGEYIEGGLDPILKLKEKESVRLPSNLADILERTEVMNETRDPVVSVRIEDGFLTIRAAKETGWYREQKRIKYSGTPLRFQVNPKFLAEVLQRTTLVHVGEGKMKLESDGVEFCVVLEAPEVAEKEKAAKVSKKTKKVKKPKKKAEAAA